MLLQLAGRRYKEFETRSVLARDRESMATDRVATAKDAGSSPPSSWAPPPPPKATRQVNNLFVDVMSHPGGPPAAA